MPITPQGLDFLIENKMRDDRAWFHEHREIYEKNLLTPLRETVSALTDTFARIDPQIVCEPKIGRSISRIFRDTRFSKDKSIFRANLWCSFERERQKRRGEEFSGFYFEISPNGLELGCGCYHMSTATLTALRELILAGDPDFDKAQTALEQNGFVLYGQPYKRSKFPDRPARERLWLDRRNPSAWKFSDDFALVFSDRLPDYLSEQFLALAPVYEFLRKAQQLRISRGE